MIHLSEFQYQRIFRFDNRGDESGDSVPFVRDVIIAHKDGYPWIPFTERHGVHKKSNREFITIWLVPVNAKQASPRLKSGMCPFPTKAWRFIGDEEWQIPFLFQMENADCPFCDKESREV